MLLKNCVNQLRIDNIKNQSRKNSKSINFEVRFLKNGVTFAFWRTFSEYINGRNFVNIGSQILIF